MKNELSLEGAALPKAAALLQNRIGRAALLGTTYTMTEDFYKEPLIKAGINVLVPDEADRKIINDVIYKKLCLGTISVTSRKAYLTIIDRLAKRGA